MVDNSYDSVWERFEFQGGSGLRGMECVWRACQRISPKFKDGCCREAQIIYCDFICTENEKSLSLHCAVVTAYVSQFFSLLKTGLSWVESYGLQKYRIKGQATFQAVLILPNKYSQACFISIKNIQCIQLKLRWYPTPIKRITHTTYFHSDTTLIELEVQ